MTSYNQPRWTEQTQHTTPTPGWTTGFPHQQMSQPYSAPTTGDERTVATAAHLSAALAALVSAGWLTFVGPLVVWLLYRDRSPFVRNAAAGAFNFALGMTVAGIVGWILTFTVIGAVIGIPLIIISSLGAIVLGIMGATRTINGQSFTYPWQLKVLS